MSIIAITYIANVDISHFDCNRLNPHLSPPPIMGIVVAWLAIFLTVVWGQTSDVQQCIPSYNWVA